MCGNSKIVPVEDSQEYVDFQEIKIVIFLNNNFFK